MFAKEKRSVIFMEIAMNFKKQRHTFLECIPVEINMIKQAPIYFKKAIQESESEWSQHKKLIDMTNRGGIKKCVPIGFPYFSVEFGDGSISYAHVIEDEQKFDRNFGRQIVAGMLQLDMEQWVRPQNDSPEITKQRMKQFLQKWIPFDWTQQLEGGEF
jgi:hypothetical protein